MPDIIETKQYVQVQTIESYPPEYNLKQFFAMKQDSLNEDKT